MLFLIYFKKICLDAGFGGESSPSGYGSNSSIDNLKIAQGVGDFLFKKGLTIFLTRTALGNLDVSSRVSFSSYVGCDLFLSLKRNKAEQNINTGIEIRVGMNYTKNDIVFRNGTLKKLLSLGIANSHVHEIKLDETVLNRSSSPSITLFLLFISNFRENLLFEEYFDLWCENIGDSIINFTNYIV